MSSEPRTEYQNITIEHVDFAVHGWLNDVVDAHVEFPGGELKKVPVVFASGERWATARDRRGMRDKNGVLILPVISVRRTRMDRDRTKMALGTETNRLTIARRIDKQTSVVQNAISSRTVHNRSRDGKIIYELTTIPFPDWFVTTYEIVIQTQYISQMNVVVEKVVDSLDIQNSFVMEVPDAVLMRSAKDDRAFDEREILKGYYFVGMLDTDLSDSGNMDEFTDQERIIKYSFNLTVPTYLQLDPHGERPAIQKETTAYQMKFFDEVVNFVDDPFDLELIFSTNRRKLP